jgi:hypothetical protein
VFAQECKARAIEIKALAYKKASYPQNSPMFDCFCSFSVNLVGY